MSRPATAAHSSSRTHSVESRASRRRSVSATLAGIWVVLVPRPCASEQPGQLPDEERVAAAAPPQLGGDLRPEALVPASVPGHRLDVGRRRGRPGRVAAPARRARQLRRTPRCPGTRRAAARARRQVRARNPSSRSDGSSAQCRSSSTTSTSGSSAARRPRQRATASNRRNWASRRGDGARSARPAPEAGSSSQPASPSSAAGRPLARRTCDHGQYGGAPSPSQQNPRRTRAAGPGLADQRGQHRGLADAGLAADHQELPGAAAGVVEHGAGRGQHRLPADEPVGSTHGAIMAGQGRSSKTRFIGASTLEPADPAEPGLGGQRPQPLLAGLRPSGSDDVARLLGDRVRCAGQRRDGVEHAPDRVEVVLHVVGAERLDQQHRTRRAPAPPGPAPARRAGRRCRATSRRR